MQIECVIWLLTVHIVMSSIWGLKSKSTEQSMVIPVLYTTQKSLPCFFWLNKSNFNLAIFSLPCFIYLH